MFSHTRLLFTLFYHLEQERLKIEAVALVVAATTAVLGVNNDMISDTKDNIETGNNNLLYILLLLFISHNEFHHSLHIYFNYVFIYEFSET